MPECIVSIVHDAINRLVGPIRMALLGSN